MFKKTGTEMCGLSGVKWVELFQMVISRGGGLLQSKSENVFSFKLTCPGFIQSMKSSIW